MCASKYMSTYLPLFPMANPKKTLGTVTITTVFPWTSGHPDSPPLMVFRESKPSSPAECWWHEPCEDLALYSFRQRERERHAWYTGIRYIYVYVMCIYMCIYIIYVYNAVCNWESSICHEAGTLRNKDIHKRNTNWIASMGETS